jgi:hypothetical protein
VSSLTIHWYSPSVRKHQGYCHLNLQTGCANLQSTAAKNSEFSAAHCLKKDIAVRFEAVAVLHSLKDDWTHANSCSRLTIRVRHRLSAAAWPSNCTGEFMPSNSSRPETSSLSGFCVALLTSAGAVLLVLHVTSATAQARLVRRIQSARSVELAEPVENGGAAIGEYLTRTNALTS